MEFGSSHKTRIGIVVTIGFLALALAFSARATLGLVMPVWEAEFGWSRSFVSGVGAAALVAMAAVAPVAGLLADRRGPLPTLALGLMTIGLGCGLVAVSDRPWLFAVGFAGVGAVGFGIVSTHVVATAIARLTEQGRGLATGVATSGATAGQLLIVPALAVLLTAVSWRWSFGGLAAACLVLGVVVMVMLARRSRDAARQSAITVSSLRDDLRQVLATPAFHILFWSFLACGFTTTGVIETHFLPYAALCGFHPLPSAAAYGVLSAVNLLGMIVAGWLTDRVNRPLLLAGIYAGRALTFVLLMRVGNDVNQLFLFAAVFGMVDYATIPATASLVASHVGVRVMGLAMGLIAAGHAIGGALGAMAGGLGFDLTGGYTVVWFGALWISTAAAGLVLLLARMPAREPVVV